MEYKVGDAVKIKSWEEMRNEFELNNNGNILIKKNKYFWSKEHDKNIPEDRIITIAEVDFEGDYRFIDNRNSYVLVFKNIIKCHANEYYLQQIKEEL